jgi:hypothetical protein
MRYGKVTVLTSPRWLETYSKVSETPNEPKRAILVSVLRKSLWYQKDGDRVKWTQK